MKWFELRNILAQNQLSAKRDSEFLRNFFLLFSYLFGNPSLFFIRLPAFDEVTSIFFLFFLSQNLEKNSPSTNFFNFEKKKKSSFQQFYYTKWFIQMSVFLKNQHIFRIISFYLFFELWLTLEKLYYLWCKALSFNLAQPAYEWAYLGRKDLSVLLSLGNRPLVILFSK